MRVYSTTKLNGAGVPYGTEKIGALSTSTKTYVTETSNIDAVCGYISSAVHPNRQYYVYRGMIPREIEVGAITSI